MPCLCLLNEKHSEIETDLLFNAVNPLRQKRNKKMMKEAPEEKKIWTISRFVRVILAQGPC